MRGIFVAAIAGMALDACAGFPNPQIRLSPVAPPGDCAPYSPGVVIDGQTIKIAHGGVRIWLKMTISGWDPYGCGTTNLDCRLGSVHLTVHNQYLEGAGAQPPSDIDLLHAFQPCSSDADCRSTVSGHAALCGVQDVGGFPITDPSHCISDRCESAFVDPCHPNFQQIIGINNSIQGECGRYFGNDGVQFGCSAAGIEDQGSPFYFGTLVLDVPGNAKGRYTIPVFETYLDPYTWWNIAGPPPGCHPFNCPFDGIGATIFIGEDCNNNVVLDEWEIEQGTLADADQDKVPDECEADCQPNGIPDDYEISSGAIVDCDGNRVPDDCDALACQSPGCRDCNSNNALDKCDIASGTEHDVNLNGVPDTCEGVVPAQSVWGLAVMALLILIASKLRFTFRASKSG